MDMFALLASVALFALWGRFAALLILWAAPEDKALENCGPEELHREYRRLSAALGSAWSASRVLVCLYYRLRRIWYALTERAWPQSARQALKEMRMAVVYLAREAAGGPAALQ
jgi:hypothetical protein